MPMSLLVWYILQPTSYKAAAKQYYTKTAEVYSNPNSILELRSGANASPAFYANNEITILMEFTTMAPRNGRYLTRGVYMEAIDAATTVTNSNRHYDTKAEAMAKLAIGAFHYSGSLCYSAEEAKYLPRYTPGGTSTAYDHILQASVEKVFPDDANPIHAFELAAFAANLVVSELFYDANTDEVLKFPSPEEAFNLRRTIYEAAHDAGYHTMQSEAGDILSKLPTDYELSEFTSANNAAMRNYEGYVMGLNH